MDMNIQSDLEVEALGSNNAWYQAWVVNVHPNIHSATCSFERNWKPAQRVPFVKLRLPPAIPRSYQFSQYEAVEVHSASKADEPSGWWPATIDLEGKDGGNFVIKYQGIDSKDIVAKDRIRPVTESKCIHQQTFLKFSRAMPEKMWDYRHLPGVRDSKAFDMLKQDTNASIVNYDPDTNEVTVLSRSAKVIYDVEKCFDYHIGLLMKKIDLMERNKLYNEKLQRYVEMFQIHPNFMGLAIGTRGKNINKARDIPGITTLDLDEDDCRFTIVGESEQVAKQARNMLEFGDTTINVQLKFAPKVIGKKGSNIQEIIDISGCVRVRIENNTQEGMAQFVFTGTMECLKYAKIFLNAQLHHIKEMEEIVERNYRSDSILRERIYGKSTEQAILPTPTPLLTPRTPITPPYPVTTDLQNFQESIKASTPNIASLSLTDKEPLHPPQPIQPKPVEEPQAYQTPLVERPCIETQTEEFVKPLPRPVKSKVEKPTKEEVVPRIPLKSPRSAPPSRRSEATTPTDTKTRDNSNPRVMPRESPSPRVIARENASPRLMARDSPSPRVLARESASCSPRTTTMRTTRESVNARRTGRSYVAPRPQRAKSGTPYKPKVDIKKANEKIGSALKANLAEEVRTEQQAAIEELIKAEAKTVTNEPTTTKTTNDKTTDKVHEAPEEKSNTINDEDKENSKVTNVNNKNNIVDNKANNIVDNKANNIVDNKVDKAKINDNMITQKLEDPLIQAVIGVEVISNSSYVE